MVLERVLICHLHEIVYENLSNIAYAVTHLRVLSQKIRIILVPITHYCMIIVIPLFKLLSILSIQMNLHLISLQKRQSSLLSLLIEIRQHFLIPCHKPNTFYLLNFAFIINPRKQIHQFTSHLNRSGPSPHNEHRLSILNLLSFSNHLVFAFLQGRRVDILNGVVVKAAGADDEVVELYQF